MLVLVRILATPLLLWQQSPSGSAPPRSVGSSFITSIVMLMVSVTVVQRARDEAALYALLCRFIIQQ